MKKLFYFCMAALMLVALSSCKDTKADFVFDLHLDGYTELVDQSIKGSFNVNVSNEQASLEDSKKALKSIEVSEGKDALGWLNDYVNKNVISEFKQAKALYVVHVKGYVCEKKTGLIFNVDKTYTNLEPDEETTEHIDSVSVYPIPDEG